MQIFPSDFFKFYDIRSNVLSHEWQKSMRIKTAVRFAKIRGS